MNTRPVSEAERLKVSMRNGSKEGEYHCQATLAQLREKREKGRPGERSTSSHVTSPSLSSSGPVTSVRQKTQSRDRTRESPPETPKGRANPPKSYNNPPIVGPNREPTPLKDSANDVALPWRNIVLLRSHHSIVHFQTPGLLVRPVGQPW